ncbi:MAG: hypothetical protein WBJ00_00690, partial [Dethiobacteria bacterium]
GDFITGGSVLLDDLGSILFYDLYSSRYFFKSLILYDHGFYPGQRQAGCFKDLVYKNIPFLPVTSGVRLVIQFNPQHRLVAFQIV